MGKRKLNLSPSGRCTNKREKGKVVSEWPERLLPTDLERRGLDGGMSGCVWCSFQQIEWSGHRPGQRRGCGQMGGQVRPMVDLVNPSAPGECLDRTSRLFLEGRGIIRLI